MSDDLQMAQIRTREIVENLLFCPFVSAILLIFNHAATSSDASSGAICWSTGPARHI
jgi:hypothetical protein